VAERNWFFRLSRYQDELLALIESGGLRIEPGHRRNEVLSFIRALWNGGYAIVKALRSGGRPRVDPALKDGDLLV